MAQTNQGRLEYAVSPQFKVDIFTGGDPKEVEARDKFIDQLLNRAVPVGDTDKVTSLRLYLQWYGSGLHNVYQAVLTGNAQIAALTEAVKALAVVGAPGGPDFDQEAFFTRLQGIVDDSVGEGLKSLRLTVGGDQ